VLCGRPLDGNARFDPDLGGAVCLRCSSTAPEMSNGARRILMKLPRTQFDKFQLLNERPEWPEAARLLRSCVNLRMHMEKFAPPLPEENVL
jgi:recombinational DNA repair protein (RecF pathway)